MKQNIYKCRIEQYESGYVKVTSLCNRQIHSGLFNEISKKVHEVAKQHNGELNWMKQYIFFEHEGLKYRQVVQQKVVAKVVVSLKNYADVLIPFT